jgi:galactokinase
MNDAVERAVIDTFARRFGNQPQYVARSPGRVNLIGEHTDYNDGWVLPAALDLGTIVAARRRHDGVLRVATSMPEDGRDLDQARVDDLRPTDRSGWTRYVRGSAALAADVGADIAADLLIDSTLPIGAGLSSSASLELGVMAALLAMSGVEVDRTMLARLGQRVENEIVGVNSGIMDQLAVACGVAGHALLIDCRSAQVEPVPLPESVRLLVLDSAAPRTLAGSAYNQRRAECESAVATLRAVAPELRALRDVTPELLAAEGSRLSTVELQRARHVVTENQRVLHTAEALRSNDLVLVGRLIAESHRSLRDDYAVSSAELDALVAIASGTDGVIGARLTGAGFGGCALALADAAHAEAAATTIVQRYRTETQRPGRAWICAASPGVHVRRLTTAA